MNPAFPNFPIHKTIWKACKNACSCSHPQVFSVALHCWPGWWGWCVRESAFLESSPGPSLVTQWLRLHLPVQGTWVQSLVKEL